MSTSQLLLPVHLIKEVLRAQEEVIDLAALLIPLCGVVDTQLGLLGEELTDVGHREDYLLHGAIQSYNLDTTTEAATTLCHCGRQLNLDPIMSSLKQTVFCNFKKTLQNWLIN